MKFRVIYPVLLATAVALPSCSDDSDSPAPQQQEQTETAKPAPGKQEEKPTAQPEQAGQTGQVGQEEQTGGDQPQQPQIQEEAGQEQGSPQQGTEEPVQSEQPTTEQVSEAIRPLLADFPLLEMGATTITCSPQENGSYLVVATTGILAKEDIVEVRTLADVMDKMRRGINELANKAIQPDSLYLLQIGASPTDITEEQRASKALPEDLQAKANALKDISGEEVGVVYAAAQSEAASVTTTMIATKAGDGWEFTDVKFDRATLEAIPATKAEDLPKDTRMLADDAKAELQQKVDAFNEAATAYILGREEAVRAIYMEKQALKEESLRKSEEAAAIKAENEKASSKLLLPGKVFSGEWKRGSRFGTIAISIRKASRFPDSIQFVGTLFDPKLPAASLDISGRCEFAPDADGNMVVDVEIYEGRYDADKPTAEVFDARDGALKLVIAKDGTLTGTMGCRSWGADSNKAFSVKLTPEAAPKTQDADDAPEEE